MKEQVTVVHGLGSRHSSNSGGDQSIQVHVRGQASHGECGEFSVKTLSKRFVFRQKRESSLRKTIRRLRGFLIEFQGAEARVGFVNGEDVTEYMMPSRYFRSNKITEPGQPFEMDEFEERKAGKIVLGTEFRPIALAGACAKTHIALDAKHEEFRKAILSYKPFAPNS
jgi:hypothetical protein